MNLEVKHTGFVKDGKFVPDNPEYLKWDIANFDGQPIELIVKGRKLTRSLRMNSYYWGVVVRELVRFFNQENTFDRVVNAEFVHEILAVKFLGTRKIVLPGSEVVEIRESTASLDNQEFIAFFENVRAWANEFFSLDIPEPNEELRND